MGMDLSGKSGGDLHFNWNGWCRLCNQLEDWGVDISEFAHSNDGALLSGATCQKVADAIEKNACYIKDDYWRLRLTKDIHTWRNCGGFEQW